MREGKKKRNGNGRKERKKEKHFQFPLIHQYRPFSGENQPCFALL